MTKRRAWNRPRLAVLLGVLSLATAACAASAPPVVTSEALLPTRLRRLSNVEYERSANALLELDEPIAGSLPPDERQDGYTINERQAAPSYYAWELTREAERLAGLAVDRRVDRLVPCQRAESTASPCVASALERLALRAMRRPPTSEERASLFELFARGTRETAFDGASHRDPRARGLRLVLSELLAAPSMLYLSELGERAERAGGVTRLSPFEIASSLAYTVSGGPPDSELLEAAADGDRLLDPDAREAEARRLLSQTVARHHFRQFVLEWLEVDQLERTAKSTALIPEYDAVKSRMLGETKAFVDEVMVHGGASLTSLLGARFTSLDATMARYYGIPGVQGPRVSLQRQGRVGLLQQASFLAAHAYEDFTSPIKRGDFVLRRVLCVDLPRPGELGLDTTMPPRDETATTRARFSAHTRASGCRSCHDRIDPLGFSFESFDAGGRRRTEERGQPVVTAGAVTVSGKTLRFRDSAELAAELATAPEARRCFARQALRYWTGRRSAATEAWFGALVDRLPSTRRDSLLEWAVAWVRSPEFVLRQQSS